jgi:predicted nucleotidyltransferase
MTSLEVALRRVTDDLRARGARFALVGGLAVSVRCEPRFTRDLDLAVAVASDREAEELVHGLTRSGYRIIALVEQEATKRLATARLSPPGAPGVGGVVVDLMFGSSGIEPEIVAGAEPLEVFAGLEVAVASVADLIALKVLARDDRTRPQDIVDLRQLLAIARAEDVHGARSALARIRELGFHRDRELTRALDELLA